jgi:hypothetical protein
LVHFGLLQPVVFRKSTELGKNLFEKLQAGTVIRIWSMATALL